MTTPNVGSKKAQNGSIYHPTSLGKFLNSHNIGANTGCVWKENYLKYYLE